MAETPWSWERLQDEIRRWRAYDCTTDEILAGLRGSDPDLTGVATPQQIADLIDLVNRGQL